MDLYRYLEAETPDSLKGFLEDQLKKITLYSNVAKEPKLTTLPDGRYKVEFLAISKKFYADSLGTETNVPVNDWISFGVLDEDDKLLYSERRKITGEQTKIELIVSKKPAKVGIDPINLLVDREPDDNVISVE